MTIDGRQLSEGILADLKKKFASKNLKVAVVVVGENPATFSFIRQKQKAAENVDVGLEVFSLKENASQQALEEQLKETSKNERIGGIILQLPLPVGFSKEQAINCLAKEKDIDGLRKDALVLPPAVVVVEFIFKKYKVDYLKKNIVIVGKGFLVGAPIYRWLKKKKANVAVIEKNTANTKRTELLSKADIIISGVGKPGLIKASAVKRGVVAIDFGFALQGNKISGDFEEAVAEKAKLFTPTPGGAGPLLVSFLFRNLYLLTKKK